MEAFECTFDSKRLFFSLPLWKEGGRGRGKESGRQNERIGGKGGREGQREEGKEGERGQMINRDNRLIETKEPTRRGCQRILVERPGN